MVDVLLAFGLSEAAECQKELGLDHLKRNTLPLLPCLISREEPELSSASEWPEH